MKKITSIALLVLLCLNFCGCEAAKRLSGIFTVEVENLAIVDGEELNDITIKVDGEVKFTLNFGETKSFDHSQGNATIIASHPSFSTEPLFTLFLQGAIGSKAHVILTTQKIADRDVVQIRCTNCESIFGSSAGNPLR